MKSNNLLAITPGDPHGIGPEILKKILFTNKVPKKIKYVVIGSLDPFLKFKKKFILTSEKNLKKDLIKGRYFFIPTPQIKKKLTLPELAGYQSGWSIKVATQLVLKNIANALVTGPINKDRLNKGGFQFPGHTEFLAHLCKRKSVTMMLANSIFRVSLVTAHLPLNNVSSSLSEKKITETVKNTLMGLKKLYGIHNPKIAICSLNPHAGEGGLLGSEEKDFISPIILKIQKAFPSAKLSGPYPSDTLFATELLKKTKSKRFDAIIAMYHDQGLIPVKLVDFKNTVNITLGLPIIRTSVDHGVGFDIVGKNIADPSSFIQAIQLASRFIST